MRKEEKINYMEIALRIAGFNYKPEHIDLIVTLYENVLKNKGDANIRDIVSICVENEKKYKEALKK